MFSLLLFIYIIQQRNVNCVCDGSRDGAGEYSALSAKKNTKIISDGKVEGGLNAFYSFTWYYSHGWGARWVMLGIIPQRMKELL